MPGAGLLDILSSDHTPSRPGIHCEVLLAGSNDLAVGRQRNIYRQFEAHITDRPANMELVLVTLPLRHDLEPDHPIHDETVLVNAYIEELAARHNIRVVDFNKIGRRHFTKHGQHLSMRGKRILAGMIVSSLALLRPMHLCTSHIVIRTLSKLLRLSVKLWISLAHHDSWGNFESNCSVLPGKQTLQAQNIVISARSRQIVCDDRDASVRASPVKEGKGQPLTRNKPLVRMGVVGGMGEDGCS
ncbi:hypothetical protein J6590_094980 [Homalodisca vitripennis]|nr:hypothetical protein J6590_094980 [Homalodisca vitripennis]